MQEKIGLLSIFQLMKSILLLNMIGVFFLFGCQNLPQNEKAQFEEKHAPAITSEKIPPENKTEVSENFISEKDQNNENILYVSIDSIIYSGLKLKGEKDKVISKLGQPDSIIEPKYECGAYSEDWQGIKFYQYFYGNMNFIVYEDNAEIEKIEFVKNEEIQINGKLLNGTMTYHEITGILGVQPSTKKNNLILFFPKEGLDEHYSLDFVEGKLMKFEVWTPC